MTVTRQSLSEYYESLSDEALRDLVDSGQLTALAQEVADAESQRRGIRLIAPDKESSQEAETPKELEEESTGNLVLLARLFSPMEAEMLRGRLNAKGVEAIIADSQIIQMTEFMSSAFGGVRILVPKSQLGRAREIVEAIEADARRR